MSAGRGIDPSIAPAGAAHAVPANSDSPIAQSTNTASRAPAHPPRAALPWRLIVVGGWALFIGGFALGQPDDETLRHWWVDGAWTLTYLATTVLSLWAALTLQGRERIAWGFFAAASGAGADASSVVTPVSSRSVHSRLL